MEKAVVSHAHAAHHLHGMGYSQETSQDLLRDLLDPIDTERDADAVFMLGRSAPARGSDGQQSLSALA